MSWQRRKEEEEEKKRQALLTFTSKDKGNLLNEVPHL